MNTIIIKTQSDYDSLPSEFKEFTHIEIRSSETISIRSNPKNSNVIAHGSSNVIAHNSSTVKAYNSSNVIAYSSSSVIAYDSSSVIAHNSSTVKAYGSSTVKAYDSSSVTAHGSSTVKAYNSSSVTAYNSSTVKAYDSSTVKAYNSSNVIAYSSSSVIAHDSSSVRAFDSSSVRAYGSSTVKAYLTSMIHLLSRSSKVSAYDNSHIFIKCSNPQLTLNDATATFTPYEFIVTPTFEQWLERGVIYADGIYQNIKNKKTIGALTLYETDQGFVAQKGSNFAHGKTLEEAKNDLRYKLSDRDTSKYKTWNIQTTKPLDEMIEAYMTITGACSFGTKQFCESKTLLEENYSVQDVLKLTYDQYGYKEFENFFLGKE